MQLSRDLDPASLKDRVRITYDQTPSTDVITFAATYTRENRSLEIKPSQALAPFQLVRIEFLAGIKGTDGGALAPFTVTFTTGGS